MGTGIGQGRITNNLGTFVQQLDGSLSIADEKSIAMIYDLLDSEGIYIGASSALNVVAAVELAQKLGPGTFLHSPAIMLRLTFYYRSHDSYYPLRWCIQISEPSFLKEVATGQGTRERDTFTSAEVRCTRLVSLYYLSDFSSSHLGQSIKQVKIIRYII